MKDRSPSEKEVTAFRGRTSVNIPAPVIPVVVSSGLSASRPRTPTRTTGSITRVGSSGSLRNSINSNSNPLRNTEFKSIADDKLKAVGVEGNAAAGESVNETQLQAISSSAMPSTDVQALNTLLAYHIAKQKEMQIHLQHGEPQYPFQDLFHAAPSLSYSSSLHDTVDNSDGVRMSTRVTAHDANDSQCARILKRSLNLLWNIISSRLALTMYFAFICVYIDCVAHICVCVYLCVCLSLCVCLQLVHSRSICSSSIFCIAPTY